MFLRKYTDKQFFCEYNFLRERVFVTQLSSNAEISLLGNVWVTTKGRFMKDVLFSLVSLAGSTMQR
jgi:hypothetical protein